MKRLSTISMGLLVIALTVFELRNPAGSIRGRMGRAF